MRWKTKWLFEVQLCQEYEYQKLLKLDNPSSSYGKKIGVFLMPHNVVYVLAVILDRILGMK